MNVIPCFFFTSLFTLFLTLEKTMNLFNPWNQKDPSLSKPGHVIIQEAFMNIHTHFFNPNFPNPSFFKTHFENSLSNFTNHIAQSGFSLKTQSLTKIDRKSQKIENKAEKNPNFLNPNIFKTHFEKSLSDLINHITQSGFSKKALPLAQISQQIENNAQNFENYEQKIDSKEEKTESRNVGMSKKEIEERLAGVPVYTLSNASNEFVLVSGAKNATSLGFFCFKKDDAVALLQQMRSMEPAMRDGSQVVEVALNKVVQLKLDGVAFRLIPELTQIKNAIKEIRKTGTEEDSFNGVPIFQSKSLLLWSKGKRYRPVFFRKEDLEKSLVRASREQRRMNPAYREGEIEVAVLENIIDVMKESADSAWADVVFIPPGFDVSTNPSHK